MINSTIALWEQEIEKNPTSSNYGFFQRLDSKINFLSESVDMDYKYCEMFSIHEGVILNILEKLGDFIKSVIEWIVGLFQKIADFFSGSRQERTIERIDKTTKVATEKIDKSSDNIKKEYEDNMKRKSINEKEREQNKKFNDKIENLIREFNRKQFDDADEHYLYFIKDKNKLDEKIVGIYEKDIKNLRTALHYYVNGDEHGNQSLNDIGHIDTPNTIASLTKDTKNENNKHGIFLGLYDKGFLDREIPYSRIIYGEKNGIKNFANSLKKCYKMSCDSNIIIKDIVKHAENLCRDYERLNYIMMKTIKKNDPSANFSDEHAKTHYRGDRWFSDACYNIMHHMKNIKLDLSTISAYFIYQNGLLEKISNAFSMTFGTPTLIQKDK